MKISNQIPRLFLSFSLFLLTDILYAQNLPDSFMAVQTTHFRNWLQAKNLHNYIKIDTVVQNDEGITLYLQTDGLKNWLNLVRFVDSSFSVDLSKVLFNRLSFQLDNATCTIVTDAHDGIIKISKINQHVNTDIRKTLGPSAPFSNYAFSDLKDLVEDIEFKSKKDIPVIRRLLIVDLNNYFKSFCGKFVKYKFEDLSQNETTLILEVSNVVDVVIKRGYFEHLILKFIFNKTNKATVLKYGMVGKYGGGIVWAPHESRYYPMIPKYQEQVEHFNLIMGNRIMRLIQ
jgi:hypothetical protein